MQKKKKTLSQIVLFKMQDKTEKEKYLEIMRMKIKWMGSG